MIELQPLPGRDTLNEGHAPTAADPPGAYIDTRDKDTIKIYVVGEIAAPEAYAAAVSERLGRVYRVDDSTTAAGVTCLVIAPDWPLDAIQND